MTKTPFLSILFALFAILTAAPFTSLPLGAHNVTQEPTNDWREERDLIVLRTAAQVEIPPITNGRRPWAFIRDSQEDNPFQAGLARILRLSMYGIAAWVLGLALLFFTGLVLSQATLAAVRQQRTDRDYIASGPEARIRRIYRSVILVTSIYFYISIPFLILVLIAAVAALLYLTVSFEQIPWIVTFPLALAGLYTMLTIFRSLTVGSHEGEPGRSLRRDEAPQLWALAARVADRVGTRPADRIYVTPGTQVAVTEMGGLGRTLRGRNRRCLILGLGVLPGLSQGQLQAILAHEYGHFTNRDTAGGDLARQVEAQIENVALGLILTRQAHWYNPAWLFVSGFSRVFALVTLGAARLQEILADRYAVMSYGTSNFTDGLEHLVRRSITFDLQVNQEVEASVAAGRPLRNLYSLPLELAPTIQAELETRIQQVLSAPTGDYDSHPAPLERIELIRQLNFGEGIMTARPAASLLPNLEELQIDMTERVQENVERHVQALEATEFGWAQG